MGLSRLADVTDPRYKNALLQADRLNDCLFSLYPDLKTQLGSWETEELLPTDLAPTGWQLPLLVSIKVKGVTIKVLIAPQAAEIGHTKESHSLIASRGLYATNRTDGSFAIRCKRHVERECDLILVSWGHASRSRSSHFDESKGNKSTGQYVRLDFAANVTANHLRTDEFGFRHYLEIPEFCALDSEVLRSCLRGVTKKRTTYGRS